MTPDLKPERIPSTVESAFPGRYATVRKHFQDRAKADLPTDSEATPDRLIGAGVFIPDTKK